MPPILCRWLIRAAGWLAPRRERSEWRARWESGVRNWWVLVERGELTRGAYMQIVRHCWGAFADAFWLRCSRDELRHWLRGPSFVLVAAAVVLLVAAVATRGFRATRASSEPLPLKDPGSLVWIHYPGAPGLPPRLVSAWRAKSSELSGLAAFRNIHWPDTHAWVTTNFFSMMGTQAALGRTFRSGEANVAVLSGAAWRKTFGGDPRVIGSTIPVDGKPYTVIGVLPEKFWAIVTSIAVWTPLDLEERPALGPPPPVNAVGRLKPSASEARLQKELVDIARTLNYRLTRPPQVAGFYALPDRTIFAYLFATLFALTIGMVLVAIGRASLRRAGWRYWMFFLVKTAAVVVILPLLWIEIRAGLNAWLPDTAVRTLITGLGFTLVFIVICAWALWWSFADQRRRCPVCLHRLAMPVTIGSWASVLEPVTTELLCEEGHGSLCLPETESGERDRWTALDASWRELFEKKPQ